MKIRTNLSLFDVQVAQATQVYMSADLSKPEGTQGCRKERHSTDEGI
jgi:hypothetical protein